MSSRGGGGGSGASGGGGGGGGKKKSDASVNKAWYHDDLAGNVTRTAKQAEDKDKLLHPDTAPQNARASCGQINSVRVTWSPPIAYVYRARYRRHPCSLGGSCHCLCLCLFVRFADDAKLL